MNDSFLSRRSARPPLLSLEGRGISRVQTARFTEPASATRAAGAPAFSLSLSLSLLARMDGWKGISRERERERERGRGGRKERGDSGGGVSAQPNSARSQWSLLSVGCSALLSSSSISASPAEAARFLALVDIVEGD